MIKENFLIFNIIMQKINKFIDIEQIIYNNPLSRDLRFTNICSHSVDYIFYYDCLLSEVVLLNRIKVLNWKEGNLLLKDFPFSSFKDVNIKLQPAFNKHCWNQAVQKAEKILPFLEILLTENNLNLEFCNTLDICIDSIKNFFNLNIPKNKVFSNFQLRNMAIHDEKEYFFSYSIENLKSPQLFKTMDFSNKHQSNLYKALEKLFYNFNLLSKYKVTEVYKQLKQVDDYIYNHLRNIHLSQNFLIINIESETISIINKINTYLALEIDKYLEKCINEQVSIMNNIEQKFVKK